KVRNYPYVRPARHRGAPPSAARLGPSLARSRRTALTFEAPFLHVPCLMIAPRASQENVDDIRTPNSTTYLLQGHGSWVALSVRTRCSSSFSQVRSGPSFGWVSQ